MAMKDDIRALLVKILRQRNVENGEEHALGVDQVLALDNPIVQDAINAGLLRFQVPTGSQGTKSQLRVTKAGRAWLRRMAAPSDPFQQQHQDRQIVDLEEPGKSAGTSPLTVNVAAGPLLWLRHRTDRKGEPLISEAQFRAGQRFAAELEKGAITTGYACSLSLGEERVDGGRGRNGTAEALSDIVLTARRNIDKATAFLGQDLSKVAIDVCFYEVKLADIEKRQGWPVRSAKVVLAIALDRLACHYGYSTRMEK